LLQQNLPIPDSCTAAKAPLFDHLVGAGEERWRHIETERPGRLQIDDELKLSRLQDRKVGRLRALQDLSSVGADLTKTINDVGSVAHQPAGFNNLASPINRGNPVARRQNSKLDAPAVEGKVAADKERVGTVANERGEGSLDLATGTSVENL